MKGHGTKMGRRRERAIKALLEHETLAEAAKAVGIAEVTLWRWLQEPTFKETFREAKRRVLDQAITNIQKATNKAIAALVSIVGRPYGWAVNLLISMRQTARPSGALNPLPQLI